ncbi:hypothetical protein ACSBR2_013124 [Camellia fascicularis]
MQSLCSGNDSSILAVTEGCQLSIWDLRMKENGGCVHRIYGSVGDIFYAVCSSSTSIAVGGADRTVTVYDPRRWMNSCTKLNCTGQIGTFCIFGRIIYFCIDVYGKYLGRLVVIFLDALLVIFLDKCVQKIFGRLLVIFLG